MLIQKILNVATGGSIYILYLLFALSICSIAIIIERFFVLRSAAKASRTITERAREALKSNDPKALEAMSGNHEPLEGRLLLYALRFSKGSITGADELMNSYILMEKPLLEKNLAFLATMASSAPFIGLLGTVLGIVKAFSDLAGAQGNPSVVMAGISEALVATAVGLFVAIPALI